MAEPKAPMRHDFLHEPLITVQAPSGRRGRSLPEVLESLGAGEEVDFPALRPHQQHAWYAFLVQLAALVVHRRGATPSDPGLSLDAAAWRQALLELSGDAGAAAWHLAVEDLALPAFFQTPVPEGTLAPYKKEIPTPDELDVVVTTRNHDVKQERMTHPSPEHWAYALATLQTMEGFLGRGNYGIARMNGGFSNRPYLSYAPGPDWSARFLRDVPLWLEIRPSLTGELYGYRQDGGLELLWLHPWDGEKTSKLPLAVCDPFFVEVCRRIRLVGDATLEARMAATKDYLLDGAAAQGDTGDVWTPVSVEGKGLTVSGGGFDYRLLTRLLFSGEFQPPPALRRGPRDGRTPLLLAQTLVRGQGQTEGYHQRSIPIPPRAGKRLQSQEGLAELAARASAQVTAAATAQRRVLHPALCTLLQKGAEKLDFRDDRTRPWLEAMDREVDDAFFEVLWESAEDPSEEADRRWQTRLRDMARKQLDDALQAAPVPVTLRPKAEARAELMFQGLARTHLTAAYPETDPQGEKSADDAS